MKRYILLHASTTNPGDYKYAPLDFSFQKGLHKDVTIDFRTKMGAMWAADTLNKAAIEYPPLYGLGDYIWTWDALRNHPEYEAYLGNMKEYLKERKRLSHLPAHVAAQTTLLVPKEPWGNVPVILTAPPTKMYKQVNTSFATSDDYNAMAQQVGDLSYKVAYLETCLNNLSTSCDEDSDDQTKALVSFGGIIKGMDDRLEDLEHNRTLTD